MAYIGDKHKENYNAVAVGFVYKGIKDVQISGEYGKNSREQYDEKPYAWYGKVKYLGAIPQKPGTTGFWVQYKKAQPGFDPNEHAEPLVFAATHSMTMSPGGVADNIKGFEYGFDWTVFKNGVLSFRI